MNSEPDHDAVHEETSRPVTSRLHPRVYVVLIAFTAWFALAVWSFSGTGLINYLLVIVSGFIFVCTALTLILSRVGQDERDAAERESQMPSLRRWATWDYDTWTGRLRGAQAATQILLPIAAAAVGMTVIGLLFRFAGHPVV